MLKLTLIIPVYNEEHHIGACLDAIANQTVMPDEVIVIDNNCSDKTLEIAEKYNFVKIIKEPNQGRGYARTAGFNAAKNEIIGRIDADSRLFPNWVEHVIEEFSKDPELAGLTGIAMTDILPGIHSIKSKLISRSYYWFAHAGFNTITMWGANMAIRKSAWDSVSDKVCLDDTIVHEDQDVSLWIAANGGKIVQDNNMLITTNGQTYRYLPKLLYYINLHHSTRNLHKQNGNLSSPKTPKLGFRRTILGRLMGMIAGIYVLILGVLFFPVDFYFARRNKRSSWLD